ncbi:MAG TPA: hypothetical protein VK434_07090 [Microvirga sp.]|nr:hypothetical protein [Microvirga sp.]
MDLLKATSLNPVKASGANPFITSDERLLHAGRSLAKEWKLEVNKKSAPFRKGALSNLEKRAGQAWG